MTSISVMGTGWSTLNIESATALSDWRASEASETLSGVTQSRFRYIWRASEASETLLALSLPKRCNITPRNVHERFLTLLTPVLTLFTDFLSAVVTSEIAQILSLYGGGFLALKWQS